MGWAQGGWTHKGLGRNGVGHIWGWAHMGLGTNGVGTSGVGHKWGEGDPGKRCDEMFFSINGLCINLCNTCARARVCTSVIKL